MKRIRADQVILTQEQEKQIHVLASTLANRTMLAQRMGLQYDGKRDLYKALGYIKNPTYNDFLVRFVHQDIANAVIARPVTSTWQGPLELIESDQAEDTEFESEWKRINKAFDLKSKLSRVDRLTSIGRYGVILLGLDDAISIEAFALPVKAGDRKLKYIKVFGEGSAMIESWENEPKNSRYGFPKYYSINIGEIDGSYQRTIKVHHSRVVHITDGLLESEVYGTPVLEAIFNRLLDIDKIAGGDAEIFWRGARPGYQANIEKDYTMSTPEQESLNQKIDEYENDLRRIIVAEGVKLEALSQQITNPTPNLDTQLTLISAKTGIPKRILSGSERGELSSAQDTSEWKEYVQARRDDHAGPHIIRPFVDRLILYGVLPEPSEEYTIKWSELYSLSEKAKVEIGKGRAAAIQAYTTNPLAMELIPPQAFTEFILGLTTEQITLINKMRDQAISEEDLMTQVEEVVKPPKPQPASAITKPVNKSNVKRNAA